MAHRGHCLVLSALLGALSADGSRLRAESSVGNSSRPLRAASDSFASFVATYGRQYRPGSVEYWRRQSLFEKRRDEAARHNSQADRLWTASVNHLSDWSEEELRGLRGYRPGAASAGGRASFKDVSALSAARRSGRLGQEKDWRGQMPVLQQPRDQGSCGSCWAIAAATLVEAYAQKASPATAEKPSVQQLVACVPNPRECGGTGGCGGATIDLAFDYAFSHGISSEEEWPYAPNQIVRPPGLAPRCPPSGLVAMKASNSSTAGAQNNTRAPINRTAGGVAHAVLAVSGVHVPFSSYDVLPRNQYTPLLEALYQSGPVGVSVAAGKWFSYQNGIFDGCIGSAGATVDHAVVAVAFGEQTGVKYWTLMNSWGYSWGENGYIRLLRRDDDGSHCATNEHPEYGTACKPYPEQQRVCGMCGILFENLLPTL